MTIPKHWRLRLLVAFTLSVLGFFVRQYVVKLDLSFQINAGISLLTFTFLTIIWTFFANINQQLDKILPFNKNTSLRISFQLVIGSALILTIRFIGTHILSDYVPFHFDEISRVIMMGLDVFISTTVNLAVISNYLIHRWKESLLETEKLEKEKIRMQYHHLKNQVNPHFLFNSFSSLQSLISSDPELANAYVGHLAKVYRYVIRHKETEIVSIATELEFLSHYMELLKIRYGKGIEFENELPEEIYEKGIVTVTLQMLIDNAIKHNEVHVEKPLKITFRIRNGLLEIANTLQTRPSMIPSNGEGLIQLRNLYGFHSAVPVTYEEMGDEYVVRLPVLNTKITSLAE
jgi:two-component system LytT family sensor kinase